MSDDLPVPCTKLRPVEWSYSMPMIRHVSYALAPAEGLVGRTGTTACGQRDAVDQERATHLATERRILASVKIHEMRACRRCARFVSR